MLDLDYVGVTAALSGFLMAIPFFGPFVAWAPPVVVAFLTNSGSALPAFILMGIGWLIVMNVLQPRLMQESVGIHPIVVLGSVLIGSKIAGIAGAIFGIPIAAVISAFFFHYLAMTRDTAPVADRAAKRVEEREGRPVRSRASPRRASTRRRAVTRADEDGDGPRDGDQNGRGPDGRRPAGHDPGARPDRAARPRQGARRAGRGRRRARPVRGRSGPMAKPLGDWTSRPQILITNDDGVESRGLLALKQALEPIGDTTVVAPDTNQSAVGHQKTLMRPLRVRERTLGDGSLAYSVDGSPTDAVSIAFLGYFGHGFDLVASGINYGANLGDDITYSGTVSAAMEAVINSCPAFAISQEYYEHPDFTLAGHGGGDVARNILEHGLSRGELVNVNVPAVTPEECEGFEVTRLGRRVYQDQLIERVDPRGHPLLLDRRPAAVGAGGPGHGLPRGRQPADRDHADPPRPHRAAAAQAAADVGVAARRRKPCGCEAARRRPAGSGRRSDAAEAGGAALTGIARVGVARMTQACDKRRSGAADAIG